MNLIDELTVAGERFDSYNYVQGMDLQLLDRTIAQLKRLQAMQQRAEELAAGSVWAQSTEAAGEYVLTGSVE